MQELHSVRIRLHKGHSHDAQAEKVVGFTKPQPEHVFAQVGSAATASSASFLRRRYPFRELRRASYFCRCDGIGKSAGNFCFLSLRLRVSRSSAGSSGSSACVGSSALDSTILLKILID